MKYEEPSPGPSSGMKISVTSSPLDLSTFIFLKSVQNSSIGTTRLPSGPVTVMREFIAGRMGEVSAVGEALQMLPAMVPLRRTWLEPT